MRLFNRICTSVLLEAAAMVILPAQTLTTLFSFGETNGANPQAALLQGTDGNLYGTTAYGGTNCAPNGCGTIFRITPSGSLTTLYGFCSFSQCPDGATPVAGLVQTAGGDFYGTTSAGGTSSNCPSGCGTVFRMTPSGLLTTIYNFCPQNGCTDGAQPMARLVKGADGALYGTTYRGGRYDLGTIFKITTGGSLTTIYSFCSVAGLFGGCADGYEPTAGLVQAADGNLYGTTTNGGANVDVSYGTVFRITPSGTLTTLYTFCALGGCTDGAFPTSGLVQAADGDFYGTTSSGGYGVSTNCPSPGCGIVYKITSSGTLTTLYTFTGGLDGANPSADLVQATDGNLYGTTPLLAYGGPEYYGTVFKITPAGSLTTIFNFDGFPPQGTWPQSALVQDTNGSFYGTTYQGGADVYYGTIFSLSVGLGPFVRLQPASGKVGAPVEILGTNLKGTTAVTFNGTPATFKVISNTLIKTQVPSGATTGEVQVITPGSTLASNVSFRVHP